MYSRNKSGPRTEPSGTPHKVVSASNTTLLTSVVCFRSVRYDLNQELITPLIENCKKKNKRNSTNSIRSNRMRFHLVTTVGSKLASKIPQTINTFFDYLDPPLNRTFFFDPIIPEDINLEISILQDNKVHGLYSSPVRLLKLAKRVISVPPGTIFNQSICSGIFPSKLKWTKMTLCPKTTDLFLCSRFITGLLKNLCTPELPSLSKIATFSMIGNTVFAVSTVPYLTYGICGWGNCALTFQRKIVTLQKRALRLIYFSKSK